MIGRISSSATVAEGTSDVRSASIPIEEDYRPQPVLDTGWDALRLSWVS
jgi:hypothetical protein